MFFFIFFFFYFFFYCYFFLEARIKNIYMYIYIKFSKQTFLTENFLGFIYTRIKKKYESFLLDKKEKNSFFFLRSHFKISYPFLRKQPWLFFVHHILLYIPCTPILLWNIKKWGLFSFQKKKTYREQN